MRTTTTTSFAAVAIVLAVASSLTGCQLAGPLVGSDASPAPVTVSTGAADAVTAEFIRVIDGDTIAVKPAAGLPVDRYGEHSVRLLGIDAPEMHKSTKEAPDCGAVAATDHLKQMLAGQHQIALVFDTVSDHTDRFGRSLAYVELDGQDLNLEQTAGGFAEAWYPSSEPAPGRYGSYRAAEAAAQDARAGSFATCSALGR